MTGIKTYRNHRFFRIQMYTLAFSLSLLGGARISRLTQGWMPDASSLISACIAAAIFLTAGVLAVRWILRKPQKDVRNVTALIVSVCAVYGLTLLVPDMRKSIIWLIVEIVMFFGVRFMLDVPGAGNTVAASGVLGWLFALLVLIGSACAANAFDSQVLWGPSWSTFYNLTYRLFAFAGLGVFFSAGLYALFCILLSSDYTDSLELSAHKINRKKDFLFCWLLILLLWLPYYIAFYPGILEKDSISEISQQLGIETLSDHHPIMHQLIIRACIQMGQMFGSLQLGVGFYTALQMVILGAVFAFCICRLKRSGARRGMLTAAFLFYSVFTVNAFFSVTMWKDVLFGASSLLLIIFLDELVSGQSKPGWRTFFKILVAAWFFATLRNNGYYGLVIGLILMAAMNKKYRRLLLLLLLCVVLLVSSFHHILFDICGIKKTRTAMMLSVPLQQVARVVKYGNPDLEDENFKVMREVFPDLEELKEDYLPVMSDPVVHPNVFDSEVFDENPIRYMKVWFKIGLHHPRIYVEAFLLQCYGYWYPDVDNILVYPKLRENEIGLEANTRFAALRENLLEMHSDFSRKQPVSALYSLGLQVWLLAISGTLLLLKGEKRRCGPIFILFGLWLTILDGPLYGEYRYLYGLVVCVPYYLGLAVSLPCSDVSTGIEKTMSSIRESGTA